MLKRLFSLSNGALLVALSLSTIAAWYSIIGLTAIFAGAVVPIIIMGTALEFAKITTTVWLRKYWHRCSWVMKVYLVPAVVLLALLTSMGIFGFLSKAHLDQNIGSGDIQAQVSLLDEKIATQRETIKSSKSMLAQMDMQVNDIMTKGDSEKSVERSVAIRKQQAKERASLQKDIEVANKEIAKLNEERAPIASELRKVEAEVGPIKYIAALIYGDNPDANVLERAVRWVIILLVSVFDPLAIMLVLAANQSKEWDENDDVEEENKLREKVEHDKIVETILEDAPKYEQDDGPLTETQVEQINESILDNHPYLNQPFTHFTDTTPMVHKPEVEVEVVADEVQEELAESSKGPIISTIELPEEIAEITADQMISIPDEVLPNVANKILAAGVDDIERPGDYVNPPDDMNAEGGKKMHGTSGIHLGEDMEYVLFEGKKMSMNALRGLRPDLFSLTADGIRMPKVDFGTAFPDVAIQGDTFVRIDSIPNRIFKFNGTNWISTARESSDTYLSNTNYLQYLVDKIGTGEYDPELLTEAEQDAITEHISNRNG